MNANINAMEDALQIDLAEAERFLKMLDPETTEFTFQTFDDTDEKRTKFTRIFHGTLEQYANIFTRLNRLGAGIFVTINKTDLRGRKTENITKARKYFLDTDGAPIEPIINATRAGKILPSCLVESSPGNAHIYWDADCELADFKPVQSLLAEKFGTDSSVHDLPRVLRLPGFYHMKRKNGAYVNDCGPFQVCIIKSWDNAATYKPGEMIAGLDLEIVKANAPRTLPGNLKAPPPPEKQEEIERVKSMLAAIPADCGRVTWRNIIWAVADTGWACAEELAREWSMSAPTKYVEADFISDWKSFDPEKSGGVKFGTLHHHAKENGWVPPTAPAQAKPHPPEQAQPSSWVDEMNQNFAWIEDDACIYRLEYADFIEPAKFKTQFDNKSVSIQSGGSTRPIGSGSAWLKHANRRQHRRLVMRPQEGLVTGDNCLNEWRGFAVKSAPGDVTAFFELLDRLVPDQNARQYTLSWIAHLIQHPENKMNVSLAFWSLEQGVGKNLLFECVSSIIGSTHATVIGQTELSAPFNGWANRKVLAVGDEVSSTDRRQDADKLKGLVTGTTIYINEKYQPAREVTNYVNFIFLSNHHDALFVDDRDRRFFVWEITAGRLPDSTAKEFVDWRDHGGLSALLHYLITYDISSFNPKAPAPMTYSKQQMANDNRSDLESWSADLFASGAIVVLGREIATSHELATRYTNDTGNKSSTKAIVGACKRLGAYARGNQVRLVNGKKVRALALDHPEYWKEQSEAEWAAEMEKPLKHL